MTIGQYIKEKRMLKGMTQEELAAKTDISIRTIQRIENDEVDPRTFTLQTIASVLEITYDELVTINKPDTKEEYTSNESVWVATIHFTSILLLVLPQLIIWIWKKDKIKGINKHAIDSINFQLSMILYIAIAIGILVIKWFIGLAIIILLCILIIVASIIATIKAIDGKDYKYPLSISIIPTKSKKEK
jgi:transcriptional regulator with XRE-family HTH domain